MATDTVEGMSSHLRGLTVTTLAALSGLAAGVAANEIAAGAGDRLAVAVLIAAIVVQFPILSVLGVDIDDFSAKDYLFVAFMTFSLWFVSWGILLTTAAL
ncbi:MULTISPECIES: EMC6-like membrane protein [Halomicrobium]|uniref:Uncharacterized protein n=2 Tax=Halomicrobium mukohataei TaxID=57705 RepID=C7NX82_HALMD|nr:MULTISPECIES: hypothetical protein [Halomicrobium]ACV46447.1 conserved hypothetical protein [Halomicrobium mukohataei DSM 12286]QCD64997.1 hypothetical protein E5139_04835 [Halomicrobium mukohataei]QFR19803.1 hypothetical protein GBQ70_04830 [Halomicrobium sp. ZPS1]